MFRDEWGDGNIAPELVVLPAGEFQMGSAVRELKLKMDDRAFDNEIGTVDGRRRGKRPMRIARRFGLGRYPVTFEEYDAFLADTAGTRARGDDEATDSGWDRGRRPAINVSWQDAQAYCDWLNQKTGLRGESRLPPAVGGRMGIRLPRRHADAPLVERPMGAEDGQRRGKLRRRPDQPGRHFCGQCMGSARHDRKCLGMVRRCLRGEYRRSSSGRRAQSSKAGFFRVLRGGSWGSFPQSLRSASRSRVQPDYRSDVVGFRVARTL